MLDGKELILATKPFAKEIRWKSWYLTLTTLALLLALLAGTWFIPNIYGRIACSIFSGLVLVRIFVIFHDHQHHTILHRSLIADAIFTLIGLYMLAPTSIWKRSHDYHHNHNSKLFSASIGSWPIVTKKKFLRMKRSERFGYLAIRHPLTIAFGYIVVFIYGLCIQSFMNNPKKHWDSVIALVLHFTVLACILVFAGWTYWLLTWCLPFLIAFAIGSYLFYAQHNFPGVTFKNNIEWSYEHAAMESSSYMVMNPFWQWVTANIGYHHIHHLNSRIPFYRLPEAMAAIPELQKAKTTTLKPRDIIACFRLKVWDPEKNKMIGFAEF